MIAGRSKAGGPLASVVIINYNGERFLGELLESLHAQSCRDFELLVIDNASSDESLAVVHKQAPEAVVLEQSVNLGFSRAANLAAQRASGRYLAMINTDIRLEPDWLEELVGVAETDSRTAALACKLMLKDRPGVLNGVGGCMNRLGYTWDRGYGEVDSGQYDKPARVLFASAGAALFRKAAFLEAGGFDRRFFMYHEDVDLGWRLWLLGYRTMTTPSACAYHHFGATTRQEKGLLWRELLGERHSIRTLIKNYEQRQLRRALLGLVRLRQSPTRKLAQLRNMAWNLRRLPETVRLRGAIQRKRTVSDRELEGLIVQSQDVPIRL